MTEKSALVRRVRAAIGSADAMTIPSARRKARRLIAVFTETVKNGGGPRTPGHTAASLPVMPGKNLPLVGKLLGHRRHRTMAGYARLADAHLVEVAEPVGAIIAHAMRGGAVPDNPTSCLHAFGSRSR